MKNLLCSLFLLLSLSCPAQAQWIRSYGIKAGLVASDVHSPDLVEGDGFNENRHRRMGVAAFAFVEWLDASLFSLVTEAGFTQRGFYFEHLYRDAQNNPVGKRKTFYRFNYVSTLALAKLRHEGGRVTPYLVGGPHLNIFLGGEPDAEGTFASAYTPTAWGGTVGVGVEAEKLLPVALLLELRYSFDVTNSLPDVPRDAYNNAFDVLLGLRF